ncbi:MAG: hypothetical protein V1717_03775 [Candidatus Micrarchaeota archaeon]
MVLRKTALFLFACLLLAVVPIAAADSGSVSANVVVTTPVPTQTPSGGGGGGGGGGTPPASFALPSPVAQTQLETVEEKKEFMIFAPSLGLVGESIGLKVSDKRTGVALPGVLVYVYFNGVFENIVLTSSSDGLAQFTPFKPGTYTYKGFKEGWTQFNKPQTVVVQREQTQLTPSPSPVSPLTGLFTAIPQLGLALLLLSLLAAYFAYSTGKTKKNPKHRRNYNFAAIAAFFLPILFFLLSGKIEFGIVLAVLEDAGTYYVWRQAKL